MLRTVSVSLGLGLSRGLTFLKVRAENRREEEKEWMAEPLSDEETREREKDSMKVRMEMLIMKAQKQFCDALEASEESEHRFRIDRWTRKEGGGGVTCVIQDGHVFEKAGVNVSVVHGLLPPSAVAQMKSRGKDLENKDGQGIPFFACGISSVIHPRNPMVPTIHFNYRYFELNDENNKRTWWFGGGCDLTPYYLDEKDALDFHTELKRVCDAHDPTYYSRFKKWCDEYFRIPHRNISRGIGGIFFDDLDDEQEKCFAFVSDCALGVTKLYLPLVNRHKNDGYGYRERQWQLVRRGHYTEFNLVYDRGTKFGLNTPGARHESILMSLPLNAKFEYMKTIEAGSPEEKLQKVLEQPRDWI